MKNIVFAIVITILVIIGWFLYQNSIDQKALWEGYETRQMIIGDKKYTLVVADTPKRFQQGLMYVRAPVPYDGMIFIFPQAAMRTFWNKNTYVDLNLYWMRDGKVIGQSALPSIEKSQNIVTVSSPEPADTVVEIIQPY